MALSDCTQIELNRETKSLLIAGYIRTNSPTNTFPDPLQSLCLLFYDLMQYMDFSEKKLQQWFEMENEWIVHPTTYRIRSSFTLKNICYRFLAVSKSEHSSDTAAIGIQVAVPPEIEEVYLYAELHSNGKLVDKGSKVYNSGIDNFWACHHGQIQIADLKKAKKLTFRIFVEILNIIPKEETKDKEAKDTETNGEEETFKTSDYRMIRLRSVDTFEWDISCSTLKEMCECHEAQIFYSPNFGIDDNWSFGCVPYESPEKFMKFQLLVMRMPSGSKSVTTMLRGKVQWEIERNVDGLVVTEVRLHHLKQGRVSFDRTQGAAQYIPITFDDLRQLTRLQFTMTIQVVS